MRYLAEWLGHSEFILEFYIAFDIILICLNGDRFIYKLKLKDCLKSYFNFSFLLRPVDTRSPLDMHWPD